MSESTVVVGAHFEFGGSAGFNGNQADNCKRQSGAIQIFESSAQLGARNAQPCAA